MQKSEKKSENSAKDRATIAEHFEYFLALMKLREKRATRLSTLPRGVFRCILEYCEPIITTRVTDHQYFKENPILYTWPDQVSYQNPISAIKFKGDGWCWFKL